MKILVINAGSSSMKFQLIDMTNESVLAKGICDRVGLDGTYKQKNADGKAYEVQIAMPTHADAFEVLVRALSKGECKVIDEVSEISAVGHRVVHGGEKYSRSVRLDETVIADIEALSELAPLHNPGAVQGIRGCLKVFGDKLPQVVVFDTAFHQTMPPRSYFYPIPYEYYEEYKIRRYGFHGTSHQYVSERCAMLMGKNIRDLKIVTCHLGNGSSITAVSGGKSVDTTMGMTPLEGVMMGTRCGSIDPSIVTYLQKKENLTPDEVDYILNKKSGILGLGGVSSDDRDNRAATETGNKRTKQAREVQVLSVKKALGAMAASMGGLDAVVFTGGIGENADTFRAGVCDGLDYLGIRLDHAANEKTLYGLEGEISVSDGKTRVYVIPTNEELVIARDTARLSK